MDEEKIIVINGKSIDCQKLSDEQLLQLYRKLKEREEKLYNRIMEYNKVYHFLPEMNESDIS